MTQTALATKPSSTNNRPAEESKDMKVNSPQVNGKTESLTKPKVTAGTGDIKQKPTGLELNSASPQLSVDELRKLRQAQQKLEWQKKHLQSRGVSEGMIGKESPQEGYDLNELVSEGMSSRL